MWWQIMMTAGTKQAAGSNDPSSQTLEDDQPYFSIIVRAVLVPALEWNLQKEF